MNIGHGPHWDFRLAIRSLARVFYPPHLTQDRELAFASLTFPTIEINGSFYSLQRPESYARWYRETPDDAQERERGARFLSFRRSSFAAARVSAWSMRFRYASALVLWPRTMDAVQSAGTYSSKSLT